MKVVLKWKSRRKKQLGRPKQKWIDKMKNNLTETGVWDEETLAQGSDMGSGFVLR